MVQKLKSYIEYFHIAITPFTMDKIMKFPSFVEARDLVKVMVKQSCSLEELQAAIESLKDFPRYGVFLRIREVTGSPRKTNSQGNAALLDAAQKPANELISKGTRLYVCAKGAPDGLDVVRMFTSD